MSWGEEDEELAKIRRKKIEELKQKGLEVMRTSISGPIEVTDLNFNEVVRSSKVVVVDCWAPWCPPCRMMAPIIDELAREYSGKVLFGKLNVDENSNVPMEYQIMSIPTFLVFKDGVLVDRIIGAMPKKALEQRLSRYVER